MRASADSMLREEDEQVFFVNHSWWKHWKDSNRVALENIQNKDFTLYRSKPSEQSMIVFDTLSEDNKSEIVFQLTGETSSINIETDGVALEGHNYVLLPGNVWREALNWYNKESSAKNNIRDGLSLGTNTEGDTLQLHLIVSKQGELTVKISIEDNEGDLYRKACRIFNTDFEQVYIWDLFGQTKNAVLNNDHKFGQDLPDGSEEHLLKLQIYDIWPESSMTLLHGNDSSGKDMAIAPIGVSASEPSLVGGSILNVITSRSSSPDLSMSHPLSSPRRNLEGIGNNSTQSGPTGLVGLHNLGNTCFMNSALQCLLHTPKLVEYFLSDYNREINRGNPLGMEGELALAFGDLLRKVWSIGRTPIPPRNFKARLARFAPQFSGYNQHDSQELLAFLLDGLHEDLNRVKDKPYIESKDSDGRLDEEVAEEYWRNHLARNDSIIVDLFQGQFKSTLVCPKCQKVSVMFDPFMYLSLPLPSSTMRPMSLTVCSTDGSRGPTLYTVTVPRHVKCRELLQALSNACALRDEEKLLLAEIYSHKIIRLIEDPLDPFLIRDDQHIAAYRFTNHEDEGPLVEFINRRNESIFSTYTSGYWKPFGMPLLAKIPKKTCTGADILELFEKLLTPLLHESSVSVKENEVNEESKDDVNMEDLCDPESLNNGSMDDDLRGVMETAEKVIPNGHSSTSTSESSFRLFMPDDKLSHKEISIDLHETVSFPLYSRKVQVFVNWSEKMLEKYDTCQLEDLSEVSKSGYAAKRQNQEPISLYACLDAFLKEEPLGPEDMWFCPRCEDHCQASKKLDLWRLPEILVVHLKRFSYSRFLKNKLETSVNFPTHDLNLSDYVTQKNDIHTNTYELYAVSNHYGSMGGGHYTAYVKLLEEGRWYNFDDSLVSPVTEDRIKTPAAYVLFYRRVTQESSIQNNKAH